MKTTKVSKNNKRKAQTRRNYFIENITLNTL